MDYPNREHKVADLSARRRAMSALDGLIQDATALREKLRVGGAGLKIDAEAATGIRDGAVSLSLNLAQLEALQEVREWHQADLAEAEQQQADTLAGHVSAAIRISAADGKCHEVSGNCLLARDHPGDHDFRRVGDGKTRLEWPVDGLLQFLKDEEVQHAEIADSLAGATGQAQVKARAREDGIVSGLRIADDAIRNRVAAEKSVVTVPGIPVLHHHDGYRLHRHDPGKPQDHRLAARIEAKERGDAT